MPATNSMEVRVLPLGDAEIAEYKDVNYISFVNYETYGIPALLTENHIERQLPVRILYVNPQNVAAVEVVRDA